MSTTDQFDWVDFYEEFAQKLLSFKNNRSELIKKVRAIYQETTITLPKLETDNKITDIDPFTVFGLFNKSSMRQENRTKILEQIFIYLILLPLYPHLLIAFLC